MNGIRLHYVEALPTACPTQSKAPVVLLLHGFPEFWYSWRRQIPSLVAAGFRVLAPDLRGYNESEKPAGVRRYRLEELRHDVLGLIRHTGTERAAVVGHDWGGVVAWDLAAHEPQAVERLVVLNAPHPASYFRALLGPVQLLKSWYVFLFQLPRLPEWVLRRRGFAALIRALQKDPSWPEAFTPEDLWEYQRALSQPGALSAAVNYYRAGFRNPRRAARAPCLVTAPTLLIWGERDRYLDRRLAHGLENWVPNLRVAFLSQASHWVQNDAPAEVNRLLLDFLGSQREGEPEF